jgi:hypothetical protein
MTKLWTFRKLSIFSIHAYSHMKKESVSWPTGRIRNKRSSSLPSF